MTKDKFLAKMVIAYMQSHGQAPTEQHFEGWADLYVELSAYGDLEG
ncbi:hypothetical protein [Aliivibrio fischeri]|nr:hypothetical protein [Aliivibrio fischeri]